MISVPGLYWFALLINGWITARGPLHWVTIKQHFKKRLNEVALKYRSMHSSSFLFYPSYIITTVQSVWPLPPWVNSGTRMTYLCLPNWLVRVHQGESSMQSHWLLWIGWGLVYLRLICFISVPFIAMGYWSKLCLSHLLLHTPFTPSIHYTTPRLMITGCLCSV